MDNLAYNEEQLDEMLDGRIVLMSPRPLVNHNIVSGNIYRIFGNYLEGKTCKAFSDGVDVYLTNKDRVVPDMMVVCNKNFIKFDGIHGVPELIVEVLSPSTSKNDRGYKKDLYEKSGVKEYWIVNISDRSVEVYLLQEGKYVLDEIYTIIPQYMLDKMTDEEKANVKTEFTTSLYSDLNISLEKVFNGII